MSTYRPLTMDEVEWSITATVDDSPVHGNAIASGDDAFDKYVEEDILARLDANDVWVWATVTVTGKYRGVSASECLGQCSYDDEGDFKASDYYAAMRSDVLATLNLKISRLQRPAEVSK